ncbi:hypothetical protein TNCV_1726411 [Trichonephila clavipes]|nr:hypothetical protein TNCV_1726411 [Trichonephila clavipes]
MKREPFPVVIPNHPDSKSLAVDCIPVGFYLMFKSKRSSMIKNGSTGLTIETSSLASTGLGFLVDVMFDDGTGLGREQIK